MSYLVLKTNLVVSILPTFVTNLSYSVFLATSFFTALHNVAKLSGIDFNFATYYLSTTAFKLARFVFDAKLLTSTASHFLDQSLLHNCSNLIPL